MALLWSLLLEALSFLLHPEGYCIDKSKEREGRGGKGEGRRKQEGKDKLQYQSIQLVINQTCLNTR